MNAEGDQAGAVGDAHLETLEEGIGAGDCLFQLIHRIDKLEGRSHL